MNYIWIILWLLVGLWSAALRKQRSVWGIFLYALLGPFGILIFALTPVKRGSPPSLERGEGEEGKTRSPEETEQAEKETQSKE
ncbi:MAG: hypothetical protein NUV70_08520 [Caldiserica bacterium]|nr:hypothetical protein [Caldisericota bacterium]